jgi:hypothetical protein
LARQSARLSRNEEADSASNQMLTIISPPEIGRLKKIR